MELRSMFKGIFGRDDSAPDPIGNISTRFKMLDSWENYFYKAPKNLYDDATVRTCLDTVARNAAKMQLHHIRTDSNGQIVRCADSLDKLLNTRPNIYMSSYDFLYKVVSMLYMDNNVFIEIQQDSQGNIIAFNPLSFQSSELREYQGNLYVKFQFGNGRATIPYNQLIHLRRHYNGHDLLGSPNENALLSPLTILNSVKQALESAVKNCMKLRYVIKAQDIMDKEDKKAYAKEFNEEFTSVANGTGTAVMDQGADLQQLTSDIKLADHEQMNFARDDLYRYYGVSEAIIRGNPTTADYNAFFETTLAPLAAQIEAEFTTKIFTSTELGYGNRIQCTIDKMEYQSLQDKVALISKLVPVSVLTPNEARHIIGFDPVEGGDKMQVTLNNVQLAQQAAYQAAKAGLPGWNITNNHDDEEGDTGNGQD